jgi:hypothetical protein
LLGLLKEETEKLKNDGTLKQSDIRWVEEQGQCGRLW